MDHGGSEEAASKKLTLGSTSPELTAGRFDGAHVWVTSSGSKRGLETPGKLLKERTKS